MFLFYVALTKGVKIDGWVDFQNHLWSKYKAGYKFMQGDFDLYFSSKCKKSLLSNSINSMSKLIKEGTNSQIYKTLLNDTIKYKEWLESEWTKKKPTILKELMNIVRIDLGDKEIKVLVVSDKTRQGKLMDNNNIAWGHSEDWSNYSMVYLCHEYLHTVLGSSSLEHAIIELATDQELRIRLNKTGEYFSCNRKSVGHKHLRKLEREILPQWKDYLNKKTGRNNVFDLIEKLKRNRA